MFHSKSALTVFVLLVCLTATAVTAQDLPHPYLDIAVSDGDTTLVRISHVVVDSLDTGNVYSLGGTDDGVIGQIGKYIDAFAECQYPYIVGGACPTGWDNYPKKEWGRLNYGLAKTRAQDVKDHFGGVIASGVNLETFRGVVIYKVEIRSESIGSIISVTRPSRVDTLCIVEPDTTTSKMTSWQIKPNVGLMGYSNSQIDMGIVGLKVGATIFKEDRRWDLSLGGASGGSDNLGKMAEVMASVTHSWMVFTDQADTTTSESEDDEDEDQQASSLLVGYHLGTFVGSTFYTDVNEYGKLSYGLLAGMTFQITDNFTIFLSWAPALCDELDADLRGSLKSGLLTTQVQF